MLTQDVAGMVLIAEPTACTWFDVRLGYRNGSKMPRYLIFGNKVFRYRTVN